MDRHEEDVTLIKNRLEETKDKHKALHLYTYNLEEDTINVLVVLPDDVYNNKKELKSIKSLIEEQIYDEYEFSAQFDFKFCSESAWRVPCSDSKIIDLAKRKGKVLWTAK